MSNQRYVFRSACIAACVAAASLLNTSIVNAANNLQLLPTLKPAQNRAANDGRIIVAQFKGVNGRNANTVSYPGGIFAKGSGRKWTETNSNGNFRFKEVQRDDWSVYLFDASRKVNIQLDLHRKQIFYNEQGQARRPLYRITSATAKQSTKPKRPRNNSCRTLGNKISRNSKTPITVKFVNRSGEFRTVMWIDFKGNPVHYADLNPGKSFTINTFASHPWMFTDGPGNCIEMFMPKRGIRSFNLTARGRNFGPE